MNNSDQILTTLNRLGIKIFAKSLDPAKGSDIANTYAFKANDKIYVLDTSCGKRRLKEIKEFLKDCAPPDILCTHYHNDHIANNGIIAGKRSRIIYHFNAFPKIRYLRTNGTGQILEMAKTMRLKPMLKRFRMFSNNQIALLMFLNMISTKLPLMFLFITSYLYSLLSIGRIYSGKSKVWILWEKYKKEIKSGKTEFDGWMINEGLYAIETPGHTDDHVMYYLEPAKTLFAGDALNFLNPNDIQFGDIDSTFNTIDFIEQFVESNDIEILATGHYMPVIGKNDIIAFIRESRNKHLEIHRLVQETIERKIKGSSDGSVDLEDIFTEIVTSDSSDLVKRVARLTFPKSTLIFLDVFILKALISMGFKLRKDGLWERA